MRFASQPTKMTLTRQRVLRLSIRSRARRVMGSNPIWGSDFFCVLLWLILYISLYFLYNTSITRDMCFLGGKKRITRDTSMCFPGWGTHITRNLCFWGRGTHITRDMCFPGRGTHITRYMGLMSRKHISQGIFVSQVGEHISLGICVSQIGEHISLGMCFPGGGTLITRDMFPRQGIHITRDTVFTRG